MKFKIILSYRMQNRIEKRYNERNNPKYSSIELLSKVNLMLQILTKYQKIQFNLKWINSGFN